MKSIELNKVELERKINPEHLEYLSDLTKDEIEDYDLVREDLLNERRFLTEYFKEKLEYYNEKFGSA